MSRRSYEDHLWRARWKRKLRRWLLLAVAAVVLAELYGVPHVKIGQTRPPTARAEYWSPLGQRSAIGGHHRLVELFPLEVPLREQARRWIQGSLRSSAKSARLP
ncbi:MAG: hypothetical protein AAGK22_29995 [Acidobacteriota bacterium]